MLDRLKALLGEDTDVEALTTKLLGGTLVLAVLVVVAISALPLGGGTSYTEFYVLNANGTASGYSENVTVGESTTFRVGIGNFEQQQLTYTLRVRGNRTTHVTRTITLAPEERWERPVSITFGSPGRHRLRLELYTGRTTDGAPYRSLRLFIQVDSERTDSGSAAL